MLTIDGSFGEGGGQILRTAVALSAVSGTPIRIVNIRAKRKPPGLKAQHLTAVKAVARLVNAKVEGLSIGSREIVFMPGRPRPGSYYFDVGTAGSVSLVLQALLPVMAFTGGRTRVTIRGGTAVSMSPPIAYIERVLLPHVMELGASFEISVERHGFYPRGGGIVTVVGEGHELPLSPLRRVSRGELKRITGISLSARLPSHVAERQARAARAYLIEKLGARVPIDIEVRWRGRDLDRALGPGTFVVLVAEFDDAIMGSDALGRKGKPAEVVGREAAEKLVREIESGAPVDRHMGDQLISWLSLASGVSEIRVSELTMHTYTCIYIVRQILGVKIEVDGRVGEPARITIHGAGLQP